MPMRHSIRPPLCIRGPTARRIAAAQHALEWERTRLALFASQILDEQQSPEERVLWYDERAVEHEQRHRDLAATQWRRPRRWLMEVPVPIRLDIINAWNRSSIPAEAAYFADFVWRALRDRGQQIASHEENA